MHLLVAFGLLLGLLLPAPTVNTITLSTSLVYSSGNPTEVRITTDTYQEITDSTTSTSASLNGYLCGSCTDPTLAVALGEKETAATNVGYLQAGSNLSITCASIATQTGNTCTIPFTSLGTDAEADHLIMFDARYSVTFQRWDFYFRNNQDEYWWIGRVNNANGGFFQPTAQHQISYTGSVYPNPIIQTVWLEPEELESVYPYVWTTFASGTANPIKITNLLDSTICTSGTLGYSPLLYPNDWMTGTTASPLGGYVCSGQLWPRVKSAAHPAS